MRSHRRYWITRLVLPLLAIVLALAARADSGLDAVVRDDAGFFKAETVKKANEQLKQIKAAHGKELVIETFASIPADRQPDWESAKDDKQQREEFFDKWLESRARALKVDGVYTLIVRDPAHLEVRAGRNTKVRDFTQSNQETLASILLESFKGKEYDQGLAKAVDYFKEALDRNLGQGKRAAAGAGQDGFRNPSTPMPTPRQTTPAPAYPPPPAPSRTGGGFLRGMSCMWIVLVIIAAIVIIRILSGLGRGRQGGYGPGPGPGYGQGYGGPQYGPGPGYYGGGGGGGGFFRNFFGGLLGGAAGSYIYDQFRNRGDQANYPPPGTGGGYNPPPDTSSGGDFGSSSSADDQGQGFDSGGSGGDFGDSGGGGGGFDSGGDSGGGGGGGDSGSSGGDF
jgi:hypothetical protein